MGWDVACSLADGLVYHRELSVIYKYAKVVDPREDPDSDVNNTLICQLGLHKYCIEHGKYRAGCGLIDNMGHLHE